MTSRDSKARFSGNRLVKFAAKLLVFGLVVFGSWFWVAPLLDAGMHGNQVVAHAANVPDLGLVKAGEQALLARDIDALKAGVVADIEQCESGGDWGIIIFDTNNEASIAGLQFQRKTIQHYEKTFFQKDVSKADAIAIAISKNDAEALATQIIFGEKDGWRNWFNCGVKVNAAARVAAIKSLSN